MNLDIDADMQLALGDALFSLFDQYLKAHLLDNGCPITAACYLDMVVDLFEVIPQRVNNASMRNEPTILRSVTSESGENVVRRCAPFIQKVVKVSNTTPVPADQALLVKSSKRLQDLLKHTRHDTIETNPAGPLKLLLPTFPNSPQSQEADICRQGEVLGPLLAQWPDDIPVLVTMTMWTRNLVMTSTESPCEFANRFSSDRSRLRKAPQDPETRLSAVFSIKHFIRSFSAAGGKLQNTLEFLQIWLLLGDLLVDDDEDVRTQVAELTCEILPISAQQKGNVKQLWTLSPPATRGRLLDHLVHSYNGSERFWFESIVRMIGQLSEVGLQERIAAPHSLERIDHVPYQHAIMCFRPLDGFRKFLPWSLPVFEEENSNLYLDLVREADLWRDAASRLIIPVSNEAHIQDEPKMTWTLAESTLCRVLDEFRSITETNVKIRKDSPLGYTTPPEAFNAIFSIICLQDLYSQCTNHVSVPQRMRERGPRMLLEQSLRSLGRNEHDDGTWLKERKLRSNDKRLHGLLMSKLDDVHHALDSHVTEEAAPEA